jgi:3,4-dihydroxy 2-butanone 4-phosphate synthase/GTP cyclohydrolase II
MHSIPELIEDIRAGKMVILVDDENRENEGDLILAADFVTPQNVNFMAMEARGLICLALSSAQIERLELPLMVGDDSNYSPNKTAFTVSIEAAHGVSTGISAADRAHTIRTASNPLAKPSDLIKPGHIFPIRAQNGGVLKRAGHTEASVDLAKLAGLNPSAVICEIMNPDGTMARVDELKSFAEKFKIKIGSIEDLIQYRLENESFVEPVIQVPFESAHCKDFTLTLFKNTLDEREHLAFVKGDITTNDPVLVRIQTENVLGDVFSSRINNSQEKLQSALEMINNAGRGVLLYLRNEDMDQRLENKLRAIKSNSVETIKGDEKDYGIGAQILRALGLTKILLLSNNSVRRAGIKGYGIEIVDMIPLQTEEALTMDSSISNKNFELEL